jgi:hypothetical protein
VTDIIILPDGGGKTTELIKRSAESFAYIVVATRKDATRVFHQAKDMGLDIPFPLTFAEFLNREYYRPGIRGVLIDDLDLLVGFMTTGRLPVLAVTWTEQGR